MSRAAAVFACALAAASCRGGEAAPPLEHFGALPNFALTNQKGEPFGAAQIRGQVAIMNFIFTRCPTVCPVFTRKFAGIARELGGSGVLFVSISVDPIYDTPPVLAAFAAEQGAVSPDWMFLTGDPALIQATAEDGLKLALDRRGELDDGTPDIVHATHFALIDKAGAIRGYYDADVKERRADLVRDARRLAGAAE